MDIHICRATVEDCTTIAAIGREAVALSHRLSCSEEDMNQFIASHYSEAAIADELAEPSNIYHIILHNGQPAGFSKIVLNAAHKNIPFANVTKLDRIYLYSRFFDLRLGYDLLSYNLALSREKGQSGMWLFTWTGNERAIHFYHRNGFSVIGSHQFKITEHHYNPNYQMFLRYSQ